MKVQEFLRVGGSLDRLAGLYHVSHKRGVRHPQLCCLKYSQIKSPMGDPLVQECRGVVLDESDNWRVVSRAFNKFFGDNEGHAATLDPATTRYQEKVDGSIVTAYHYDGLWEVQTSGTPDASGRVWSKRAASATWEPAEGVTLPAPATFAEYFWQVANLCAPGLFASDLGTPESMCFTFELTGPLNRVVVRHKYANITLIGGRNMITGNEMTVDESSYWLGHRVPKVREFQFRDDAEMRATFFDMSPLSQEGYIKIDADFNRRKCKSPAYVALHHAKDGMTDKAFVEIVRTGETSEVLAAFPEYPEFTTMAAEAKAKVDALVAELEEAYGDIAHHEDQKVFARQALKTRCSAAMFSVRSKRTPDIRTYVATMRLDVLMDLLGYARAVATPAVETE